MLALLQMFVPGSDAVSEMKDATDTVSHHPSYDTVF